MAGNVLRELIARVVLQVDDSTIKRLDTQLDGIKANLAGIQAAGKEGVKVTVDATAAERDLVGIRIALRQLGDDVSPELAANLRQQLDAGKAKAEELRAAIDKLRYTGNADEEIAKLQTELSGLEGEARETAAALRPIEEAFRKAEVEARKLADETAKRATEEAKRLAEEAKKLPGIFGKIQENWGKLGAGLQTLGIGLGVAGLTAFVHGTLEAAGAVEDLADRLGMGTDEVQVWSAFAKQAGADTEALTASTKGLANAMQGAANGGKEQKAAFDALGISTDDWKKGLPDLTTTLALVGGRLGELDNEGQRLALTQKLLSEGGLKLAPAFKGGTEAVQEQLAKLKELAVVYSEDFVKSAGEAGDELDMFYGQFRGLGSELILTFLPALRGAVRELTPLIRGFREGFANSHIFTTGLLASGAAGLASFGGIGGALARLAPMLGRVAALAAPFIAGFAKIVAVALIFDDFWVMLNGGKSVLGELLGKFEFGRTVLDTFQQSFKLFKGSVMLAWGALSGDQGAIDKGKALLGEFSAWIDGFASNVGFMFNDLFTRVIPEVAMEGWNSLDASTREALAGIWDFVSGWASELGAVISGVWDAAINGLLSAVNAAADIIGNIPGVGDLFTAEPGAEWQPISPSAQRAKAALDAGGGATPTLPPGAGGNVTINNNQQVNTTIGAGATRDVVNAVDRVGRTVTTGIERDSRQTKRFVTGAG